MSYPLLLQPVAGESLLGFLCRVAAINRFNGIGPILDDIGHGTVLSAPMSDASLSVLSERVRVDESVLKSMQVSTLNASSSTLSVRRNVVSLRQRICPLCLDETGTHHLSWHLKAVTHCPIHATPLQADCGSCGQKLDWRRANLRTCFCGKPLVGRQIWDKPLSGKYMAGLRLLFEKCGGERRWPALSTRLPAAFAALKAADLSALLVVLGKAAVVHEPSIPTRNVCITADGRPLATLGLSLLLDWPNGLRKVVERNRAASDRSLVNARLKKFLSHNLLQRKMTGADAVLFEIHQQLFLNGNHGTFGFVAPDPGPHLMHRREAIKLLGKSSAHVSALIKQYDLTDPAEADGPYRHYLIRDRVQALAERQLLDIDGADVMSVTTASRRLGICQSKLRDLASRSLFGDSAKRRFEREHKLQFLHGGEFRALGTNPPGTDCVASLEHALGFVREHGLGFTAIAVVLQNLGIPLLTNETPARVRTPSSALIEQRLLSGPLKGLIITSKEALQLLGTTKHVLIRAQGLGLIRPIVGRQNRYVLGEIEQFLRDYTFVARLSKELDVRSTTIGLFLSRHGFQPIGGDNGPNAEQRIFRKTDLDSNPSWTEFLIRHRR
ncbi:TniQ family protein [Dongia sp.]|uniref:TniQ family protein n=1 Tax=Dongia sp. TaxID=1977262 RepID=UPI0035ADE997